MKYLWFVNFKYVFKKKKLGKNSSFNWFTPFHVLIRPDVIWKNLSRPLYHVHFTVIHTNSRHKEVWAGSYSKRIIGTFFKNELTSNLYIWHQKIVTYVQYTKTYVG